MVNAAIPDGKTAGVSHSITINGNDPLESLEVALQIKHPAPDELVISLTGPTGIKVILHNRTFSSQSPFSPVYETVTPSAESLKTYLGTNPQGKWTLTVADLVPNKSGTLLAWGLRVRPASIMQPLPPTPVSIPAGLFTKVANLIVDASPVNAVAGDANNDGLDDLFVISEQGNQAAVYFSNGTALTDPPLRYSVNRPQKIVTCDFNKDGFLDFALASQTGGITYTTITVFLANSAGGFSQGFTAQVFSSLDRFAAVDATGDGIADLIVGGIPQLVEGVGDGSFKPAVDLVYLGKSYWANCDLNRDGGSDLLVSLSRGGTSPNADPYILYGTADLSFTKREKIAVEETIADSFAARLDHPGRMGFAALAKISGVSVPFQLYTIFEDSSGKLVTNKKQISSDLLVTPVTPYDLNGDGLDELIYVSKTGIYAFQTNSSTSGGQNQLLFDYKTANKIAIGNYFSNGSIGMAIIASSTDVVLVKSTKGPLPTPTPIHTPTPSPTLFLFPTLLLTTPTPTSTPAPPTPTPVPPTPTPKTPILGSPDINGDGVVDKLDLLILMQYWGKKM